MCFSCQIEEDKLKGACGDSDLHLIVEHLREYSQQTPLESLAKAFLGQMRMDALAKKLFDTYDDFLAQLDNADTRDHLENLDRNESATDERYKYVRNLSHTFQDGLTELFLEENDTKLLELTKVYGVF